METNSPDLRSLSFEELERALSKLGQPKFRAAQIFSWAHQKGVGSFEDMANLPKELRAELAKNFRIERLRTIEKQSAKDGTLKYLFGLPDGEKIESVLLDDEGRRTICLSTQVGCKMGCAMCATAMVKFRRNLTAGEIAGQVIEIEKEQGRISNLVYMGMGEPLDNYDSVLKSIRILNHPRGKNIGQRHITISTCGLIPQIRKLAGEKLQIRLAISLNASNDEARSNLIPPNKKHPLAKLIEAAKDYVKETARRITVEYVLMMGINDSPRDAQALAKLLRGLKANVNLIEFNPFAGTELEPSGREEIKKFREVLESIGMEVTQRYKRGQDIDAACGQLRGKHETK
jgi:23S rRNA (adenine2503-C2)-methyltransferase